MEDRKIIGMSDCFIKNVVDIRDLAMAGSSNYELVTTLRQKPLEDIELYFSLTYGYLCSYSSYNCVRKLNLATSITFHNFVDEVNRFYEYQIRVKVLVQHDNQVFHLNFPKTIYETRNDYILNFEQQSLLIMNTQTYAFLHICFDISRTNLQDTEKKDLSSYEKNYCSFYCKNPNCYDTSIIVGDQNFPVYKEILCSKSDVFAAMFDHEMQEKNTNIIKIEDFQADVIEEMIKFAYTNEISETIEHPQDLYAVAHKYQMEDLKAKCIEYLIFNLNFSNAASLYKFANLYNVDGLITTLNLFFKKYDTNMVQEESYRSYLCENINSENLEDILFLCAKFNESLEDVKKTAFTFIKNNISQGVDSFKFLNWFKKNPKYVYELFQFIHSKD